MFNFLGSLASLIGLVFSILAFVFAKRASAAAREARDAAMRQSLSEYLNGLARIAAELVAHLRSEMNDMALLRVSDLMDQTSYLIGRWAARLPRKSKDNLSRAQEQLLSIHQALDAVGDLTPEDRARLAHAGQEVSGIFSTEHGVATRAAGAGDE
ncbi:MAG TPA: hypothetical protein VN924_28270 [Bryobacteraceae bacterium]|nr:hypothetical protein [Bryobacteraceae bacterium]